MAKNKDNKLLGHLAAAITIVVWGTTFIASKILLEVLSPTQLMSMRFVLAYIFLRILKPKHPKLEWKDEIIFFVLGIAGCSAYFWCENAALLYTQTTNVSIIVAFAPILTSVFTHVFTHGERLSANVLYGFLVAIIGIALVVFNGTFYLKLSPKGDLLSLGAAVCWAIYSTIQNTAVKKYDPIVFSSKVMLYGFISSLPLIILNKEYIVDWQGVFEMKNLLCLLFLGFIGSGVCYVLWRFAGKHIGIISTGNYIYLIPFITMVASFLFLKQEKLTVMAMVGSVLVILGVIISQTRFTKKARK